MHLYRRAYIPPLIGVALLLFSATAAPNEDQCNSNNGKNCPSPTAVCDQGNAKGNPHCATPTTTPTYTPRPTTTSTSTPTVTATPTVTVTPVVTVTSTPTPITGGGGGNGDGGCLFGPPFCGTASSSTPTATPRASSTPASTPTPVVVTPTPPRATVTPAPFVPLPPKAGFGGYGTPPSTDN